MSVEHRRIKLCVEGEQTSEIHAEELVRRLLRHFPATVIDWERGDAHVQAGLDHLIRLGAPDVILESHKSYFGNVVFVSVSESRWGSAIATSFVHTIWPPLGDAVVFDVHGATDEGTVGLIARELRAALGMLIVQPIAPQPLTLDELLRGVTDENLPGEWDTGPTAGREAD
jgi:hypothetical protein